MTRFRHALTASRATACHTEIDDKLIQRVRRLGRRKTKEEALSHRKRLKILSLFGTVDFDPNYDYKAERRKRG